MFMGMTCMVKITYIQLNVRYKNDLQNDLQFVSEQALCR